MPGSGDLKRGTCCNDIFHGLKVLLAQKREHSWRSGERARLPPIWLGFGSGPVPYMGWLSVVGSRLAPRVFLLILRFSSLHKKNQFIIYLFIYLFMSRGQNGVWNSAGSNSDKMTPLVSVGPWALPLQTIPAITKKGTNILFVCASLLTVPAA